MSAAILTIAGSALLTGQAQAQTAPASTLLSDIEGVASHRVLADGRLEVTLENGQTLTLQAGEFTMQNGAVLVQDAAWNAAVTAAGAAGGAGGTVILGVLAGAGLVGAVAGGGGGGGASAPAPAPAPEPTNTAPSFTSGTTAATDENSTGIVYTATATDADGDTLTYSISGADVALFDIDASTGEVTFKAAPDFEAPGDADGDNVYEITVTVSDGTDSVAQDVSITVNDVDENVAPVITSAAAVTVDENTTDIVYTATATDADGDTVTFTLTGADAALFDIDAATGEVTFKASPDFETPSDADGDNVYEITVVASDGSVTSEQAVTVTVNDVDENVAPVITSAGAVSVDENTAGVVYTASATDADGDTVTYALSGADAALFDIDASTGEVSFKAAPDYESPADADSDNAYEITVEASDGSLTAQQAVTVTVNDVDENAAPVITSAAAVSVDENTVGVVYTASATDADGDTVTYALSGADAALFDIDASTGEVSFKAAPDHESPADADGDNVYEVTVEASDGTATAEQAVSITVDNLNDNTPEFTIGSVIQATETIRDVAANIARDADGDELSFSISGTDARMFRINEATGELYFASVPNRDLIGTFDADQDFVYEVTISVVAGGERVSQDFLIQLNDVANILGTTDAEILEGTNNNDIIYGLGGDDTISGFDGDDILQIRNGSGTIYGGAGDDQIRADGGAQTIYGGDGDDSISVRSSPGSTIFGEAGDDFIYVYDNAIVDAGTGDDYVSLSMGTAGGFSDIETGDGVDRVVVSSVKGSGASIDLGGGDDQIQLGAVSLTRLGIEANTAVTLGAGSDLVILDGLAGNAWITDFQAGDDGDVIRLNMLDLMSGYDWSQNPFAAGIMRIEASGPHTNILVDLQDGNGWQVALVLRDTVPSALTAANFDGIDPSGGSMTGVTITGTDGEDIFRGNSLSETTNGGEGRDLFLASAGDDILNGEGGDDVLYVGRGNQTLNGGDGHDAFYTLDRTTNNNITLNGDAGNDFMFIFLSNLGSGTNLVANGGIGDDTFSVGGTNQAPTANVTINGGDGNDFLFYMVSARMTADLGSGDDYIAIGYEAFNFIAPIGIPVFTLGSGRDTIDLIESRGNIEVTDFEAGDGGDVIKFSYTSGDLSWNGTENPFVTGAMSLQQVGADTVLTIKTVFEDTVITFSNTQIGDFTAENFDGFDPAGAPVDAPVLLTDKGNVFEPMPIFATNFEARLDLDGMHGDWDVPLPANDAGFEMLTAITEPANTIAGAPPRAEPAGVSAVDTLDVSDMQPEPVTVDPVDLWA